ncbi:conserved exported hypothetical protein [Candidatus Terasakiella magnetica]|nr:conserved exported hypothetical protein [Candidatus Terasakiella magnetica]
MRLTAFALLLLIGLPAPASADQITALDAVKSQQGVTDAQIDGGGTLWVMVKPNPKVAWDQYAAYMCGVVRRHQARVFVTRIVDMTSTGRGKKSSEWKVLAQMNCGRLQ